MRLAIVTAFLLLVILTMPTQPAAASSFTVTATNTKWTPATLAVTAGDSVTFANGGGTHTWVSTSGMGSCSLPCTKTFADAGSFSYKCGVHLTMTGTVSVAGVPELAVSAPFAGATVSGSFVATGSAWSAGSTITSVTLRLGSQSAQSAALSGAEWSGTVNSIPVANGEHSFAVKATNALGSQTERVLIRYVANPPTRDLSVASIASTTDGLTGQPTILLGVKNGGNEPSGSYHILVEYQYHSAWRTISDLSVTPLPGKSTLNLTIPWDAAPASHVGRYVVRATLDSRGEVVETNEANNAGATSASWFTSQVSGVNPSEP